MNGLKKRGVQTSIHYPPIHRFSYYQTLGLKKIEDLRWTDYVGDHEVTLPMYPALTEKDVHYICHSIRNIVEEMLGNNIGT
jgi:dTDP-4-amino-4,6-dideoxygalactose transaminase